LGALPVISNWLCGALILWRNELSEGRWICINGFEGEISSINTIFLQLVPLNGGTITIPMLKVFLSPIEKYASAPKETFDFEVEQISGLENYLQSLSSELSNIVDNVEVKPTALLKKGVRCRVSFPISSADTKTKVLYRIVQMGEHGGFKLGKGHSNE